MQTWRPLVPNIVLVHVDTAQAVLKELTLEGHPVWPFVETQGADLWSWLSKVWNKSVPSICVHGREGMRWLSQPRVVACIKVWWITFTVVFLVIAIFIRYLGFGSKGIIRGSLAAAFQSFMYGAFTPAGGVFATLTSIAMLGRAMPVATITGALIATGVARHEWARG